MNLKDILVHIDNRPTCKSRLEKAIQIAKRQQAQLTGIYVIPHPHLVMDQRDLTEQTEGAFQHFKQMTDAAAIPSEYICVDSSKSGLDVPNAINLYAHYHDLLILSQTDQEAPDRTIPDNLPGKAVLGSGRPVLFVPYAGAFKKPFKRILLAWRGGSESTRALHDAMPILRKADEIKVIMIHGRDGDEDYQSHQADICKHMERYQLPISCETQVVGELSVGDLLLNRCAEFSANLLVMGATSHSRRGQQTVGSTGRHLLKFMTVPVLMSH